MEWTEEKPISEGWYFYASENYEGPVLVEWTGFVDIPNARQLEITSACGEEAHQPLGWIERADGLWSDKKLEVPS